MGSCIHATAPGWAQYGTTYPPIHSPERIEREAALGNEWRGNEWDGEKWGELMCVKERMIKGAEVAAAVTVEIHVLKCGIP